MICCWQHSQIADNPIYIGLQDMDLDLLGSDLAETMCDVVAWNVAADWIHLDYSALAAVLSINNRLNSSALSVV